MLFGIGIFLLNLAVSYYTSSKHSWLEPRLHEEQEKDLRHFPYESTNKMGSGKQGNNAKTNTLDTMPSSIGSKQLKVFILSCDSCSLLVMVILINELP